MGFFRIPDPEGLTSNFFHLSLLLLFLDPRSEIRDPGSEIRDPGWVKIRSRDKNPGSATLILTLEEDIVLEPVTVEPVNSRGNIGL
jgi:hypothetical protein